MAPARRHPDKDVRPVVDEAVRAGWHLVEATGHAYGWLLCGDGCRLVVYSTPRGPQAKILQRGLRKCPHGHGRF
jgi:hypothetical protein